MTPNESGGNAENTADETRENVSDRFDRLPATADDRAVTGRPTREAVLSWWAERFGIDSAVFELYSFWERGAGKIWAFHGKLASPVDADGLGMMALRTRQEHWKPTLEAAQRFGGHATRNVMALSWAEAATFLAGEDQERERAITLRVAWPPNRWTASSVGFQIGRAHV